MSSSNTSLPQRLIMLVVGVIGGIIGAVSAVFSLAMLVVRVLHVAPDATRLANWLLWVLCIGVGAILVAGVFYTWARKKSGFEAGKRLINVIWIMLLSIVEGLGFGAFLFGLWQIWLSLIVLGS